MSQLHVAGPISLLLIVLPVDDLLLRYLGVLIEFNGLTHIAFSLVDAATTYFVLLVIAEAEVMAPQFLLRIGHTLGHGKGTDSFVCSYFFRELGLVVSLDLVVSAHPDVSLPGPLYGIIPLLVEHAEVLLLIIGGHGGIVTALELVKVLVIHTHLILQVN